MMILQRRRMFRRSKAWKRKWTTAGKVILPPPYTTHAQQLQYENALQQTKYQTCCKYKEGEPITILQAAQKNKLDRAFHRFPPSLRQEIPIHHLIIFMPQLGFYIRSLFRFHRASLLDSVLTKKKNHSNAFSNAQHTSIRVE